LAQQQNQTNATVTASNATQQQQQNQTEAGGLVQGEPGLYPKSTVRSLAIRSCYSFYHLIEKGIDDIPSFWVK
jgi:hypothetical protein